MDGETVVAGLIAAGVLILRDDGTVWRAQAFGRTGKLRPIAPRRCDRAVRHGYRAVTVTVDGKDHSVRVHRLAWTVHQGPIPPGMEINHRDGDKANNRIDNLELATRSENMLHSYRVLNQGWQRGADNPNSRLTTDQVGEIRAAQGTTGCRILGRRYGVSKTAILKIWRGELWSGLSPSQFPAQQTERAS